ncbi:cysteine-rich motor neuron 1 protein [Ciona intestinalis]
MNRLKTNCADVKCVIKPSPRCPEDSEIIEGFVPTGECCPTPSHCQCRPENCAYLLCSSNEEMVRVRAGSNTPGSCCDVFECRPRETPVSQQCDNVRCASYPLSSIECPSDSTAVRDPNPSSECCPGDPICQCKPCTQPTCSGRRQPKVTFRADGKPGSCCDEYSCRSVSEPVMAGCSVNGTRHLHGTTYEREECRVCECRNGVSYCERKKCPTRSCTRLIMRQGACCPECDNEVSEPRSAAVQPSPSIPAVAMCMSKDGLSVYSVGETWSPEPCTQCRCGERGERICESAFCYEPSTVTMIVPTCPSMSRCRLATSDCPNGFMKDRNNCRLCKCKADEVKVRSCPSIDKCQLKCTRGFVTDNSGCQTCACLPHTHKCKELTGCIKQCPYGYRLNKKGCDRCKCRRCPSMDSCDKECTFGLSVNDYGCSICKCKGSAEELPAPEKPNTHSCLDDKIDRRRDDGETWSNDCFICVCRGGDVMCDVIKCPVPSCHNPMIREGDCCPSCNERNSTSSAPVPQSLSCQEPGGNWYVEGETWKVSSCTTCVCHRGLIMCTSRKCPATKCMQPILHPGECCPKCPEFAGNLNIASLGPSCKSSEGEVHKSGSSWKTGPCTSHACLGGTIQSFSEQCPKIQDCVSGRLRGQCCPTCLGTTTVQQKSCQANDTTYRHGELWNDSHAPCVKCRCTDGEIECFRPMCDPVPAHCPRVFRRDGACCDECELPESGPPYATSSESTTVTTVASPKTGGVNWLTIVLAISAICIVAICVLVVVISMKKRCSTRHLHKTKYTGPTSKTTSTDRSMSTASARNIMDSTSSESDRKRSKLLRCV